jgi:hypothetical protein
MPSPSPISDPPSPIHAKPLGFRRNMVLARRRPDNPKLQTRRIISDKLMATHRVGRRMNGDQKLWLYDKADGYPITCPYGQPGQLLYVKEDFQLLQAYPDKRDVRVRYLADDTEDWVPLTEHEHALVIARRYPARKTPGRFMYRSLARDLPTLEWVRVERLQDISKADAMQEGIERANSPDGGIYWRDYSNTGSPFEDPRKSFKTLWDSIHGRRYNNFTCDGGIGFTEDPPASWEDNPWVWALGLTPFKTS